jgi:hypothetical protein
MYLDDFIAQQIMKTNDASSTHDVGAQQPIRRLLRTLWSGVRQVAWGIDAAASVWHGIEVPPDHGARSRPPSVPRHPRPSGVSHPDGRSTSR